MRLIETEADIAEGVAFLCAADPHLAAILEQAGPVPLRRHDGGFAGLTRIVMGQQLSLGAADAINKRLQARLDPFTPEKLLRLRESTLRGCGLSGPKIKAMRAIASAMVNGDLLLDDVAAMAPDEAAAHLTAVKGIGPWTAEIYLMFCVGHADIFPAGDLALQVAWQQAAGLAERPDARTLAGTAVRWQPWRGVAARLLWAHYRQLKAEKSGAPL